MSSMKRNVRSGVLTLATALFLRAPAFASGEGPYAVALSRCLVKSTSPADKTLLVQWMFATVALHPDVRWMAEITDNQRADLNRKTASLFEKLLTQSCLDETRQAMKHEGEGTVSSSFSMLGQEASRELFANPSVTQGIEELGKHIDADRVRKALDSEK